MAKRITELPAATTLDDVDDFIVTQAGVSKKLPASLVGGSAGPFGTLAFEWNGIDTSQFSSAPDFRDATGGAPGTLSIVSTAEHGNVLRYTGGPAAGNGVTEIFLANDPLVFDGEKRDMLIDVRMWDDSVSISSSHGGVAMLCSDDASHGFALGASVHTSGRALCINNGVVEATPVGGQAADLISRYLLFAQKPAGAAPFATLSMTGVSKTGNIENNRRTGSTAAARAFMNDMGNNSTLGATWNGEALDRWGLAMLSPSGGNPPATCDFASIRVFVL